VAADFNPPKMHRKVVSDAIHRHGRAENELISNGLPGAKDPKGTGGSNPFRSSNEALRTVGPVRDSSTAASSANPANWLFKDYRSIASFRQACVDQKQ
jgi:hypothetical protein